jgi:tetratricopeptide (TPR) repeat protein
LRLALEELSRDTDAFTSDLDVQHAIAGKAAIIFRALRDDAKSLPLVEQQVRFLSETRPADDAELLSARDLYARTLFLQGQPEESHRQYDALVAFWKTRLDTKDGLRRLFLVRRNRAEVWGKTGRKAEALAEFADIRATATEAIRQHNSWPILLRNHAEALIEEGLFDEAEQAYQEALTHTPLSNKDQIHNASSIYQRRGAMLAKKRQIPEAIASIEKAIELQQVAKGTDSPWLPEWWIQISRFYTAKDKHAEAIAACQSAVDSHIRTGQTERQPHAYRALAENWEAAGDHESAAAAYRTATELEMQKSPLPIQAWLNRSRAMVNTALCGRLGEAAVMAHSLEDIRRNADPETDFESDLSLIASALAFTQTLFSEQRAGGSSAVLTARAKKLALPVLKNFLQRIKDSNHLGLPSTIQSDIEAGIVGHSTIRPVSSDFLAFDQALNDKWRGEDIVGEWFLLAAALRLVGQPDAAITLYQTAASHPPEQFIVTSRKHMALIAAAETHLLHKDSERGQAILSELETAHRSGEAPITNALVRQQLASLNNSRQP